MKKVPVWLVILSVSLIVLCIIGSIFVPLLFVDNESLEKTESIEPTPTITHLEFEGFGNDIVPLNVPKSGTLIISAAQVGEGYFAIEIKDSNANFVDLLGNCLDDCKDRTFVNLDAGSYILEISSRADWIIIVTFP
jgi:hypothetical protein